MRSSFNCASLRAVAATVVVMLAPAMARGQGAGQFEGVVTFRTEGDRSFDYSVHEGKVRIDMSDENRAAAMIVNPGSRTMYMLMPEQQMYMEMKMPEDDIEGSGKKVKPVRTGKSEVVAGHKCDYWKVEEDEGVIDVCLASDMGGFQAFSNRMIGDASEWQKAIGKNAFPLKVITHVDDGEQVALVATKVEKRSLDASLFAPPSSWKKMQMNMKMPGTPR